MNKDEFPIHFSFTSFPIKTYKLNGIDIQPTLKYKTHFKEFIS